MADPILSIKNLTVRYSGAPVGAVRGVSLHVNAGESVGLIGESGSGKSSIALAVMALFSSRAQVGGEIFFGPDDLTRLPEREMDAYRWRRIALVFQNSLDVLNPVLTIGEQIAEGIRRHRGAGKKEAAAAAEHYLALTGLAPSWAAAYPHQLSGGMRQKVLIAMALSCEPEVLLVDEPTMALDSLSKQEIISLLRRLQREKGFAMLVISHELPVIAALTSRVLVLYAGSVLEEGETPAVLRDPAHPYTRGLICASPSVNPYRDMWGIPGELTAEAKPCCPFYGRCSQRTESCAYHCPALKKNSEGRLVACLRGGIATLLQAKGLTKRYSVQKETVKACENCRVSIRAGEVCSLIGESGSGKTTLAEMLAGILPPDAGEVTFEGLPVQGNSATAKAGGIQMVFQDPLTATNERLTIEEIIREPLDILREEAREKRSVRVRDALRSVQLPQDDAFVKRRGFMLSSGQRQRIAVARALVMRPKLLIADEISAMLDPSTAANLLRLLKGLQNTEGFAMLYITHDLALARKISDRIAVMRRGKIIEQGPAEEVLGAPREEYTRLLVRGANAAGQLLFSRKDGEGQSSAPPLSRSPAET